MASYATQTDSSTFAQKTFSYQHVDGLQAIYVGFGIVPHATFVFKSAEKAKACVRPVLNALNAGLEVWIGSNLSNVPEERTLSYKAEWVAVEEQRITTIQKLIDTLGNVMRSACPSKEKHGVLVFDVSDQSYLD